MVSETFPNSYTSPHIHSWIFKTLRVIIFWVRVTHKMLNVNWEKNWLNNFISHLSWFQKLSPTHTHPLKTMSRGKFLKPWQVRDKIIEWIFSQFTFKILWVTLTQKIITCRVSKIHEWLWGDVYHSWIFETLWVIIFWVRVTRKMQPQNKGPGMLWGQSYVLPMTWGGGGIWGAPFGRHAALRLFHFLIGRVLPVEIHDLLCLFL